MPASTTGAVVVRLQRQRTAPGRRRPREQRAEGREPKYGLRIDIVCGVGVDWPQVEGVR
jgi:hypothetical protein